MTPKDKLMRTIRQLHRKAEAALREAIAEVVKEHQRRGEPLLIWRDGKVVRVPASKLRAPHG